MIAAVAWTAAGTGAVAQVLGAASTLRQLDTRDVPAAGIGAVHTWARCTQAPLAPGQEAYAASDSNTICLFDNPSTSNLPHLATTGSLSIAGAALLLAGILLLLVLRKRRVGDES
ncbi:hypothetical protein AB0L13_14280 [Saccharopolyspora shandongensis]|uniref:hypothetical protein n=1 Tax=Saccharopolyspora shandongensis TaxID=418495 RepID=UPI0034160822